MVREPDDPAAVSGPFTAEVHLSLGESVQLRRGELASVEPEKLRPVRIPRASHEGKNKTGRWYSSLMKRHVLYESLLERNRMLMFDFDTQTKTYLEQPVKLRFKAAGKPRVHVPDLLVWRNNAPMVLCDVKPTSRLGEKNFPAQAKAASEFCEEEAIEYAILSEPEGQTLENLRWLRGYWQVPYRDSSDFSLMKEKLGEGSAEVSELLMIAGPEILSKPVLFSALWWREFSCDLSAPLGRDTTVWGPTAN